MAAVRILHVITSLTVGGAETMLANVALGLDHDIYRQQVISLTGDQPIGTRIAANGVVVTALHARGGILTPCQFARARQIAREWQPDIVHTWMYHANVVGHLLMAGRRQSAGQSLLTSVRGANNAPRTQKVRLRFLRRIDACLSSRADAILFNSSASARQHFELGYDASKAVIIPNGFDVDKFRPQPAVRPPLRAEFGWASACVVALIGRFDPLKGQREFLRAAAEAVKSAPKARFVLIGRGCDEANRVLVSDLATLGIAGHVRLLGERPDIERLLNAMDIVVCPSISESFPNAVGEAMSAGIPCIVTDVGDCAYLVGDTGLVVAPGQVRELANAIVTLATATAEQRADMGARARAKVQAEFTLEKILSRYRGLYDELSASAPSRCG